MTPELLAPAGDWACLRAAVANGADAVYFGLTKYSARQRATNFALQQVAEVIGYLHERNVRGYVAFNTLVFCGELPEAAQYVRAIASAGADAVIVQDLGLARLVHRMAPGMPIHASTQTTQTEPGGIERLKALGVRRVILARELPIEEIARIAAATDVELEVFVHGALCASYSGQCLASEALWGRSANRGLCAQACRLPYRLLVDGDPLDLGQRKYLLSMPDLAAWDRVAALTEIGVAGLKIEGRLKSAEYVAATTRAYRAAIDAAAEGRDHRLPPDQERELRQSFSRGFSRGFLDGANHQGLIHGLFARHLGVRVGVVTGAGRRGLLVRLDEDQAAGSPLKTGDGVVFDDGRPQQEQQGGRVYAVDPFVDGRTKRTSPGLVEIKFRAGEVDLRSVRAGAVVWRTDDPDLRRELRKSFARDQFARRVGISVRALVDGGGMLCVVARDAEGNEATAMSVSALASARKHPMTVELLEEQFSRLGQTPFELASVELAGPEGPVPGAPGLPFLAPKSVLNDLRRQVVQKLLDLRRSARRHEIVEPDALDGLRGEVAALCRRENGSSEAPARCTLGVLVRDPDQMRAVLDWAKASAAVVVMVYCDFPDTGAYPNAVAAVRRAGLPVGLATLRILRLGEEEQLAEIADCRPDAVLVRNLGSAEFLRRRLPRLSLVGDASLNVANELAAGVLLAEGLTRLTPAVDLSFHQLLAMMERVSPEVLEVVIHQHVPMFHMEHCLFAARLSSGADRRTCGRPCSRRRVELLDRVGEAHPLLSDPKCRNTVYNAHAQSAAQYVPALVARGLRHFRVELLREGPADVGPLLDCYADVLAGRQDGAGAWRRVQAVCRSRVTRGTLQEQDPPDKPPT